MPIGIDQSRIVLGYAAASRFAARTKALEVQVVTAEAGRDAKGQVPKDAAYSRMMGLWCVVAPPAAPATDALGNASVACDLVCVDLGDQPTAIASRDARVSPFGQDVKPGEAAFVNIFGSRLYLGEKTVALNAGGGFLSIDVEKKTVSIAGVPSAPGKGAPYLVISTAGIGLVSETGAASVNVHGSQATLSGSSCSLDFGSVRLGKGAADPVVMNSLLSATLIVLQSWINKHTHPIAGPGSTMTGTPSPPLLTLSLLNGSVRVKTA